MGEEDTGQDLHLGLQGRRGEGEPVGAERQTINLLRGDEESNRRDEGASSTGSEMTA